MGAPQPPGIPPKINDDDINNDPSLLKEFRALYAKERKEISSMQPKLFAHLALMLSPEAFSHVKSHPSYEQANVKKSPHLLLQIIHNLFNTDDADSTPQSAKAATLVSLANFKVLNNELLVVAADRLARTVHAANTLGMVGQGLDDPTLAHIFLNGLPSDQFGEFVKVITNTTSLDNTKAPTSVIELRKTLQKLGAPDRAGGGTEDTASAMAANVSGQAMPPAPSSRPRPRPGSTCSGCGVVSPDHFPSECPAYTPEQRAICLKKYNSRTTSSSKKKSGGGGVRGGQGRNGKGAEGSAAATKGGGGASAQTHAATKKRNSEDRTQVQAGALDIKSLADKVASRVIKSIQQADIAPELSSESDSESAFAAVESVSANTLTARHGEVKSGISYYDTGATGHVEPEPLKGERAFEGPAVRLTGIGGYTKTVTSRCRSIVKGTTDSLVVSGSPSLLSASVLLVTHFVEIDRDGNYYLLEPRDHEKHEYLVFVRTSKGLYALAEMYRAGQHSGDGAQRSWANKKIVRAAGARLAEAWGTAVRRLERHRATVSPSEAFALQELGCAALESVPRRLLRSDDGGTRKLNSNDLDCPSYNTSEFALTTFAEKLARSKDSVKSNVASRTVVEIQAAKLAELYLRALGTTPATLSRMLSSGLISGALITPRDVRTAQDVFGGDPLASAAVMRSKPPHVEIAPRAPRANASNVQAIDLFKLGGHQVLLSKFFPAKIKMCSVLPSKDSPAILEAVLGHRQRMLERGFTVSVIHSDKEPGLVSRDNKLALANKGVRIAEYATAAHVVHIEANVAPTRRAVIVILATCLSKYGYHAPMLFLQRFLDHVCVVQAFTGKEGPEGTTPGQSMFNRTISAIECSFPPGSMCLSVIPKGSQRGKDVMQAEEVIYLGCRGSETRTAAVFSLSSRKVTIREINELSPRSMTKEAVDILNRISDAERKQEKGIIIPRPQLGSAERDIDPQELNIWQEIMREDQQLMTKKLLQRPWSSGRLHLEKQSSNWPIPEMLIRPEDDVSSAPLPGNLDDVQVNKDGFEGSPYNSGNVRDKLRKVIAIAAITRMKTTRAACAFNISVDQAFAEFPEFAEQSITLELENILRRTFRPIDFIRIGKHQKIIPSKMFLKPKWTSSGEFDKLKCRLVGGGHRQNSEDFGDLSAPTLGLTALFALLAIAAFLQQHSKCADVPSAYLHAPLDKQDGPIFVRLDKKTSEIVIKMRPELAKLADPSGRIVGEVEYALYGLIQSAMLWYQHITGALVNMGFTFNEYEPCVMNKTLPDGTLITVGIFVDDMKFFSVSLALIDATIASLERTYGKLTVQEGDVQSYLGMTINTATKGQVDITMEKYVADVLSDFNVTGTKSTPAKPTLLEVDQTSPLLSTAECDAFRSKVMRIYYLARRVRPDMLTAAAFLTRRTTKATVEDAGKLDHLLKYLNGTRELGITLCPGSSLQIYAFVDAAYGTHFDMKSHTGCVIQIGDGGGAAYCKSVKQTIVSKSSTEAELIAASDMSSQIIWLRNFMQAQGHKMEPAILLQDNMSTIALINTGRAKAEKSRHINVRYFWIRDRIEAKEIVVEHKPTEHMLADALTKPLTGSLFTRMRALLLNNKTR